jgi:glycosyltransferase involved in cell wall biosynthesis
MRLLERFPRLPSKYVFFLGTLTSHKNVPRLVEAVARARQKPGCEQMHLVLSGKRGTGYDAVAAAIRRHRLGSVVHELGYVEDEHLPALYENARVHVLPSFTEGFGLPITEAMAAGTPVVTSNRGAMAEVAGDAALLVDPSDTEAMADALVRLWTDRDLRHDLRERGRARAALFTWEASARRTWDVLRRVAERGGARGA